MLDSSFMSISIFVGGLAGTEILTENYTFLVRNVYIQVILLPGESFLGLASFELESSGVISNCLFMIVYNSSEAVEKLFRVRTIGIISSWSLLTTLEDESDDDSQSEVVCCVRC